MGTPKFARVILEKMLDEGYEIELVCTKPDTQNKETGKLKPSAVKIFALSHNLKIAQPKDLRNPGVTKQLREINPDLIVVAAYGKILPKELIEIPKFGALNVHASLLPRFRGASPIQSAILAGCAETGATIMLIDEGLDTGKIIAQKKVAIAPNDDTLRLSEKLANLGSDFLIEILPDWLAGKIEPFEQDEALGGGVRITAQIVDCQFDKLAAGLRVRIEFRRLQKQGDAGILCYGYKCVPA